MKPLLTLILSVLIFANTSIALAQQSPLDSFIKPERNPDGTIVSGSGFVPCSGADCSPCDLVVMFNTILKWVMLMVFLIFAIIAVKAGINMVVKGTASELSAAKKSFINAFIGLFIILAAWLMVDTLLRSLLDGGNLDAVHSGYGPWSKVQCATQVTPGITEGFYEGDILYEPPSYYSDSQVAINSGIPSGGIQQRISSAALAYKGSSTAAGPGGGNLACAWAVNNVMRKAGLGTIDGDSVIEMEKVLVQGRGKRISQSGAVAGDLVLLLQAKTRSGKTGNHVGVCLNNGCTSVLSNSSSKATFSWTSGPTFSPSYSGGTPRFYRVTN